MPHSEDHDLLGVGKNALHRNRPSARVGHLSTRHQSRKPPSRAKGAAIVVSGGDERGCAPSGACATLDSPASPVVEQLLEHIDPCEQQRARHPVAAVAGHDPAVCFLGRGGVVVASQAHQAGLQGFQGQCVHG